MNDEIPLESEIDSLKELVYLKNKQLMSSSIELMNKDDKLKEVINKIDNENFKRSEIKSAIEKIIKSKDYWKEFKVRFNETHPQFCNNLQQAFPILNINDINFCALLKMKLSNKEIAELLQISHESVISKKYRLKRKMGINDERKIEDVLITYATNKDLLPISDR
ncbi:hypothetical protein E0W72_05750 [Flavobacterium arcticum]|uniref:helix-turn-helix transcriptional regulator n=1 Tax=Flavobacterium arcticum TaxID=1784713 RepID=UPI0013C322C9|nr:LuxR C-terminal-related transcriptional regulator [Flavobacterium arcticum]KAF2511810.1 hypothetical protein E0W72_05750 [Flavobacterium arcticum]